MVDKKVIIWIIIAVAIIVAIVAAIILLSMENSKNTNNADSDGPTDATDNTDDTDEDITVPLPTLTNAVTSLAMDGGSYKTPEGGCINAVDSNAVGWVIRNNYSENIRPKIASAYGVEDCNGNSTSWGSVSISPESVRYWNNTIDKNGAYLTFYNNCKVAIGINDTHKFINIGVIDVDRQYIFIDVDKDGNVRHRIINN